MTSGRYFGGNSETAVVPQTTALALRSQLAEAQQQLVKAKKKYNAGDAGTGPVLGGVLFGLIGSLALVAGIIPPFTPITTIVGAMLLAGGATSFGIGGHIFNKAEKDLTAAKANVAALEKSSQTITEEETQSHQKALTAAAEAEAEEKAQRLAQLRTTAEAEFDRVLEKFDMRAGMVFPVASDDDAPKVLRIEHVETEGELLVGDRFAPAATVTARLYDAHIGGNGKPVRGQPAPDMPVLKRTIVSAQPEKVLPR
jgi:hypothetical protein